MEIMIMCFLIINDIFKLKEDEKNKVYLSSNAIVNLRVGMQQV